MKKFNNNGQLAYGPLALQLPGPAHGKRHKAPKMLPDQPVPARNKRTPLLATVWEPTFHEMSLKEYANRFHHDTNPAWETEVINDGELRSFVQRALDFARR